jgi:hypothetical protein
MPETAGRLSGAAPGPQRAKSRTTPQRARTLGVPAGSDNIGNLHSRSGTTRSTSSTPHTCRPPREARPAPDTTMRRRARAGTSSALCQRACSLRLLASSRETHLERHDRLANHREQPRRQRDQLRRELRVRHTGGDRRKRLPVPREQHRHEQLEPLQEHTRSFAHARSGRTRRREGALCRRQRSIPRSALSRTYPDGGKRTPLALNQYPDGRTPKP